jgi:EAL domain-containing protein (putative c-di-GMP-specific phosphodiesterase class I)
MNSALRGRRHALAHRALRLLAAALLLGAVVAPAGAGSAAVASVESDDARGASPTLPHLWSTQLTALIDSARTLATAADTVEFLSRPNLPYVDDHYDPDKMAAEHLDAVLIVDLRHRPLFWRRLSTRPGHGFADARAFLGEIPPLPHGSAGLAAPFAGWINLTRGPALVVAFPIYEPEASTTPKGWLIAARELDAAQWRRFTLRVHPPAHDVHAAALTAGVTAGLAPFPAASGGPDRVAAVSASPHRLWFVLALVVVLTGLALLSLRAALDRRPPTTGATKKLPAPAATATGRPRDADHRGIARLAGEADHPEDAERLRSLIDQHDGVFLYQPQIDLQTGTIGGVESVLCAPGPHGLQRGIGLVGEIEAAGLGAAFAALQLRTACRDQAAWSRQFKHDFPVSVRLSDRAFNAAGTLALARRIMSEQPTRPASLELLVNESALAASATALRLLDNARNTGLSFGLDAYDAGNANMRLLAMLPISKLRVDAAPLLRTRTGVAETLVFGAIIGAARSLGILVCASGVDSEELLRAVLRHARPLAQGNALGLALGSGEFLQLLRVRNEVTSTLTVLAQFPDGAQERASPAGLVSG